MLLLILPNAEVFKTLEARVAALLIPSEFKIDEALKAPILLDDGKELCGVDNSDQIVPLISVG